MLESDIICLSRFTTESLWHESKDEFISFLQDAAGWKELARHIFVESYYIVDRDTTL